MVFAFFVKQHFLVFESSCDIDIFKENVATIFSNEDFIVLTEALAGGTESLNAQDCASPGLKLKSREVLGRELEVCRKMLILSDIKAKQLEVMYLTSDAKVKQLEGAVRFLSDDELDNALAAQFFYGAAFGAMVVSFLFAMKII